MNLEDEAEIARLLDGEDGWNFARQLARTPGVKDSASGLAALRARALYSEFPRAWFAVALALTGDHKWLHKQPIEVEAVAVSALYQSLATRGHERALDYSHLERVLTREGASALVEEHLEPGRGYVEPDKSDLDELERGAKSEHPVIRWHAASLLGTKSLRSRKRAFAALTKLCGDEHPLVIRLAVLSAVHGLGGKLPDELKVRIRAHSDSDDVVVARAAARV